MSAQVRHHYIGIGEKAHSSQRLGKGGQDVW